MAIRFGLLPQCPPSVAMAQCPCCSDCPCFSQTIHISPMGWAPCSRKAAAAASASAAS
ncbi:MAG: hypothetical protein CM15mP77_0220 [Synechococcus sp.]|nr:MAG: hypothetical protein CM15mP77_0220 [Synechococcus sp.]